MPSDRSAVADGADLSPAARRILAAADELFYQQGAAATTVRAITAACDLTPGALYNHFPSKEELVFQLVMRRHLLIAAALDDAISRATPTPVARFSAAIRVFVRIHVHPNARRGTRVANRDFRALSGPLLAQVVAVRRKLRDNIRDLLLEGARAGSFSLAGGDDPASATLVASTILDMCVHAAEWVRADGPIGLDAVEDRYVEMALRLVGAT